MNQIAKQSQAGLVLPAETRLKEVQDSEMKQLLIQEILKLYFMTGNTKHNPKDIALTATEVYNDLMQNWPGIKIEWIQKAFKLGIREEFGEYYGINYATLMKFINTFRSKMKKEDFVQVYDPRPMNDQAKDLVKLAMKNPDKLPSVFRLLNEHKSKRS